MRWKIKKKENVIFIFNNFYFAFSVAADVVDVKETYKLIFVSGTTQCDRLKILISIISPDALFSCLAECYFKEE